MLTEGALVFSFWSLGNLGQTSQLKRQGKADIWFDAEGQVNNLLS